MGWCNKCNRKGMLIKVGADGLCADCQRLKELNDEESLLKQSITKLKTVLSDEEQIFSGIYDRLKAEAEKTLAKEIAERTKHSEELAEKIQTQMDTFNNRETLLHESLVKLKADREQEIEEGLATQKQALADLTAKVDELTAAYEIKEEKLKESLIRHKFELQKVVEEELAPKKEELAAMEQKVHDLEKAAQKFEKGMESGQMRLLQLKNTCNRINYAIETYANEESFNAYAQAAVPMSEINEVLPPTVEVPLNAMNDETLREAFNKNRTTIRKVVSDYNAQCVNRSNVSLYKAINMAMEAELQNILYSISKTGYETATANIKRMTRKYYDMFVIGNQQSETTAKRLFGELEFLFLEALKIENEHYTRSRGSSAGDWSAPTEDKTGADTEWSGQFE